MAFERRREASEISGRVWEGLRNWLKPVGGLGLRVLGLRFRVSIGACEANWGRPNSFESPCGDFLPV